MEMDEKKTKAKLRAVGSFELQAEMIRDLSGRKTTS